MPVVSLSLGFVFGTLFALVGSDEKDYLSLLRLLREPRKVPKRLRKYYHRRCRKQLIEMSDLRFNREIGSSPGIPLSREISELGCERVSYDLESLPSLCSSDTDSDGELLTATPSTSLELQFLSFWDQPGLPEPAP